MDQDESACVARDRLPMVGSGASAGGVEALGQLFNAMPEDLGSLSKGIRELCIFSAHGVVRGPPRRDDRLRQRVESQVMEAFAT